MSTYYTVIIFISIAAMIIIQISVSNSLTLPKNKKILFHLLFSIIAIAAFCEWLGVALQGTGESTRLLHIAVKAIELSISPFIAVTIATIIEERRPKVVYLLLCLHILLEWLSGAFGFIYSVDENSVYVHEDFYWIYVLTYLLVILYAIFVILRNVGKYQYNGAFFFLSVVVFMLSGIVIQSINNDLKVDYVSLAVSALMLYILALDMLQQTDQLTELINRRGYENYISHIDEKCTIIFFDIDSFKQANDQYGHLFGDFCISQTGKTIKKVYAKYGKCFRYGGDEFCAVLMRHMDDVEILNSSFMQEMALLRKKEPKLPFVSIGYTYYDPENGDILDAIGEADQMMYRYKELHKSGPKQI